MRVLLYLCLVFVLPQVVRAQVSTSIDVEYSSFCMVDTLVDGTATRFTRLVNISTLEVFDLNPATGTVYTVVGSILTCEAYDLLMIRDPLDDLYDNCQCAYTISQEDHRVTEIRGGAVQEYDVEFQEVVRRQCAGQDASIVVHRDTLTETADITSSWNLGRGISFTTIGQFIDDINFRLYDTLSGQQTITVDLNPNTVVASYPGLAGLNTADFEYDGSNVDDIAAAYTTVIQHALGLSNGPTSNTVSAIFSAGFQSVTIRTELLHQPDRPYAILPAATEADYSLVISPSATITFSTGAQSLQTQTSNYSEQCELINTVMFDTYVNFTYDTPLDLQPVLTPNPTLLSGSSNPTAFCNVSPAICAELAINPVALDGCVEICSDVLNIAGHLALNNESVTLAGRAYNSISIYITSGPVQITLGGIPINYPTGWSNVWSAAPNGLLNNAITIDATGGEAIISFVR